MNDINLRNLNSPQKIGQIVMPRLDFRGSDPLPQARELVRRFHVGGFIVFGGGREQVKKATEELQTISDIPLLFACDAERGVAQIVSGTTRFPSAMSLGAVGDEGLVYRQARFIAEEMKSCGLNLIFAPVVDINTNPGNPIINVRSYGDDPLLVSRLGAAFVRGSQDGGILACAKHFPGHGGVAVDSHVTLPHSEQSRKEFEGCDLIPFREAIKDDVASVMVAHLAVPKVDSTGVPATISEEIVRRLLIQDLGFRGLVITDSFYMGAITELGREEDTACLSLLAGCDIILDPREPANLLGRLNEMIKAGEIPEPILDNSVEKIITAKNRLNDKLYENSPDETRGQSLLNEIATRSVCRLTGGRLRSKKATVYVLDVTESGEDTPQPFLEELIEAGIECKKKSLSPQEAETFLPENESRDEATICLVYTSVAAWKGHTNLPRRFEEFLKRVAGSDSEKVLVSFGSPYVVRGFETFDTVLCAFDRLDVCQRAAAAVFLGKIEPGGNLPVRL